jgi:hypothetical protein
MGAAAHLTDALAHRHAGGRWLATGGGGYDVYSVVPRAWSLVWLAGAHRPPPEAISPAWLERWTREAARFGRDALPVAFEDKPSVGATSSWSTDAESRAAASLELVRAKTVPMLIRTAVDAGWWRPDWVDDDERGGQPNPAPRGSSVDIEAAMDVGAWAGLELAARVAGPFSTAAGHALVDGALRSLSHRAVVTGARVGRHVVGLAVSAWDEQQSVRRLLSLRVAPGWRRQGLAHGLLRTHVAEVARRAEPGPMEALVTTAERDVVEPLARDVRADMARRLLGGAGFRIEQPPGELARVDALALRATWPR